ncbi:glycosyltransferase family 1 protein [Candidatus Parcubacteria bacterium]|nr:MAG: glycosyltransferase family 1 protein [Candidatus Parcubacteria bacterium]
MKKIWIDGFEANVPQRLGSSQIAFGLLKTLEQIDKKNEYTILLTASPMEDLPKERVGWRYRIIKPNAFKTWIAIPWALFTAKEKPDLFFSPTHYTPGFSPVKKVMMVFDLAYLRFPQFFKPRDLYQMKLWTYLSIKSAERIITISKASRDDIVKFYNFDKQRITVAYPGYDNEVFYPFKDEIKVKKVLEKYGISGDYILFIGTIQPRKNLIRLMEAFCKIDNLKLVVVGKTKGPGRQGWMYEEILNKPKELGIEGKVIFTGFAPTEDLSYLMRGAVAYALPSLWEGFGIPVVESMACGTPAIVSNISSLPEVVGPTGIQVDPYSVEQIEQAIRIIAFDKKLRAKMSKEGIKWVERFSWEKMAKEVLRVFEGLGGLEGKGVLRLRSGSLKLGGLEKK